MKRKKEGSIGCKGETDVACCLSILSTCCWLFDREYKRLGRRKCLK